MPRRWGVVLCGECSASLCLDYILHGCRRDTYVLHGDHRMIIVCAGRVTLVKID